LQKRGRLGPERGEKGDWEKVYDAQTRESTEQYKATKQLIIMKRKGGDGHLVLNEHIKQKKTSMALKKKEGVKTPGAAPVIFTEIPSVK